MNRTKKYIVVFISLAYCLNIIFSNITVKAAQEGLDINHYPGDYTFFNSNYVVNSSQSYLNASYGAYEGNSVTPEPLDYQNPKKGNRIIMTKTVDNNSHTDAYLNISLTNRDSIYPGVYYYKNFMLDGEFLFQGTGLLDAPLVFVGDKTSGSWIEQGLVRLSGNKLIGPGATLYSDLKENVWYHIQVFVDENVHRFHVYLENEDGEMECIGKNLSMREGFNKYQHFRTSLTSGVGTLMLRNWDLTGLFKKPEHITENGKTVAKYEFSPQFTDDSVIKSYLADKIAFHGDGNIYYKNGEKVLLSRKAKYKNSELYVYRDDFNAALNSAVTYSENTGYTNGSNVLDVDETPIVSENGECFFPVKALTGALGFYSKNYDYGSMIIISGDDKLPDNTAATQPWFDETYYSEGHATFPLTHFTEVEEISNYLFYDRPSAKQIEADFNDYTQNGSMHPRLILTPQKVSNLKALRESDVAFEERISTYITQCESLLSNDLPIYEYSDGKRTLSAANSFNSTVIPLAFCYQITGEERYAECVIEHLLTVSAFADYNPGHTIDMGMWLTGLAIGYDWCYEKMTTKQRDIVSDALIQKGVEVLNKAYYGRLPAAVCTFGPSIGAGYGGANHFPKWKSNYIAYIQGGLTLASLAIAEKSPEVCFDTLEKSLRSWEYSNFGFYPHGTWVEGKTYQTVVNVNMSNAFGAMQTALNEDYNVLGFKGVRESFSVLMNLSSETGSFTYGDDTMREPYAAINSAFSFFGSFYNDDDILSWRNYKIERNGSSDWRDFIYYQSDKSGGEPFKNLNKTFHAQGAELFTVHEDWNDKNGLFFAAAGGPTRHYHFHNDGGDFMLCMDGEMWTWEIGQGDYNLATNYERYSGRTEGHNTLTINPDKGFSQEEQSYAYFTEYEEGSAGAYAVLDMTELYAHHGAKSVHRGFYIGDDYRSFTVRDEMNFSTNVTGYWFMHTRANPVLVDENTVKLTRGGNTLFLKFEIEGGNADKAELSIMDSVPLPTSPTLEGDTTAGGNGVKKVAIYFEGSGDINITVRMAPDKNPVDLTPISNWTVPKAEALGVEEVLEDFEGYNEGATNGLWSTYAQQSSSTFNATVTKLDGNKVLYVNDSAGNGNSSASSMRSIAFDYSESVKDCKSYSVEYKMKLAPENIKKYNYSAQNLLGLGSGIIPKDAYVTLYPPNSNDEAIYIKALDVWKEKVFMGDVYKNAVAPSTGYSLKLYPHDWNLYRFDVHTVHYMENNELKSVEYVKLYINGRYAATSVKRAEGTKLSHLNIGFDLQYADSMGFYLDDIKVYKRLLSETEGRAGSAEIYNTDDGNAWVLAELPYGAASHMYVAKSDADVLKDVVSKSLDENKAYVKEYIETPSEDASEYTLYIWDTSSLKPLIDAIRLK